MTYGFNDDRSKVEVYPKTQTYSKNEINGKLNDIKELLPTSSFDNVNTVDKRLSDLADLLPASMFNDVNTIGKAITSLFAKIGNVDELTHGSLQVQVNGINDSVFTNRGINPDDFDFDDHTIANGSYFVNQSSSGTFPSGKSYGLLIAFSAGSSNAAQLMFCDSSLAYRLYVNDTWQAWTFC